jgi:transcriptional regulator with XRE-family HTH domain
MRAAKKAGRQLRRVREELGLSMRDVEKTSLQLAKQYHNRGMAIPPSRLSEIESKGVVPSIYTLHALALIYYRDVTDILAMYGVG